MVSNSVRHFALQSPADNFAALHTAIALATHDKKKRTQRGSRIDDDADIEINEKHFEQLRERREVFIAYRNSIDRRTEEQRAAAAKDRARLND